MIQCPTIPSKKKAVSVIVATLILMMIAVGAAGVVYVYAQQSLGSANLSVTASEELSIDQVSFTLNQPVSAYVQLTITNSQTSATSAPFQQMVTVNPSLYTSYEATDLGNVRFYSTYSSGTFSGSIDSWLESVASTPANQASSATFWINIPSGIGASSSVIVYMAFLSSTSTEFDGVISGEASQLSSTYGQYDNGANVFLYYNSGASTSNLNVVNGGSVSVASVTNPFGASTSVLSLAGSGSTSTSSETVAWYTSPVIGDQFIAEGWVNINTNLNGLFAIRGSSSSTTTNYIMGDGWSNDEAVIAYESGTTNTLLSGSGTRAAGWFWDQVTVSGSAYTVNIYSSQPYLGGTSVASTSDSDSTLGASNQYIGIATWAGSTSPAYFFEIRFRGYPPNGVMPSATPSSLVTMTPEGATLYIRNEGSSSSTISSIYVLNATSGSLIAEVQYSSPTSFAPNTVTLVSVAFVPEVGAAYEFSIITLLGNSFSGDAIA